MKCDAMNGQECIECGDCVVAKKAKHDISPFHKHLDSCHRCSNSPFNLCVIGKMLLSAEVGNNNGRHK